MQDDELIEGCRRGSRGHFSELYDRFAPAMYGICLRYSGSAEEAEDILQEGFMNVFMQLKTYDSTKGSPVGWMRKIFIHKAIDYYRRRMLALNVFQNGVSANGVAYDEPEEEEMPVDLTMAQMLELIRELPVGYRTVFNLYVIEENSHKEIGALLGIAENTSKSQLMKARRMLQEKIKKYLVHNTR